MHYILKDKTKYGKTKHCERCLQGFWQKHNLEKHLIDCKNFKIQRTVMPTDTHIKFKNTRKQLEYPVAIYAGKSYTLFSFAKLFYV